MIRRQGALRQHLGPRGIPSFNGEGGQGGSSAGTSDSSDYGGRTDPNPAGYGGSAAQDTGGFSQSIQDFAGRAFGANGWGGTGYGFGGLGVGVGAVTALGDIMGAIAAANGIAVDEPTGIRGGNPANFGGGDQGNDVGGASDQIYDYISSGSFRPVERLADLEGGSAEGKNPLYNRLIRGRFGYEGPFGGGQFIDRMREEGRLDEFNQWQQSLPGFLVRPDEYSRADLFRDVGAGDGRLSALSSGALSSGLTPAQVRSMSMGALSELQDMKAGGRR